MSLNRKRKKELRKLQNQANRLWESQQVLFGQANSVAREAGRQLGKFGSQDVGPAVQHTFEQYAAPVVDRSVRFGQHVLTDKVVPTAGAVVGGALSAWDAANETRVRLAKNRGFELPDAKKYRKKADKYSKAVSKKLSSKLPAWEPERSGPSAGSVIAIVLGVAAAVGVAYAAWQTLRADDELWVADDPLRAPDA